MRLPSAPRHFTAALALLLSISTSTAIAPRATASETHTKLVQLTAPRITAATDAVFLTASNPVENLIDGDPSTEFASAGKGTQTFVEFDFGKPTAIAGFRHQDRRNGTIAASELTFFDAAGKEISRVQITHADRSSAVAFKAIWPAVTASRVRWQVTKLGAGNASSVGGAELCFYTPGQTVAAPTDITAEFLPLPIAKRSKNDSAQLQQPLRAIIDFPYAEPMTATLQLGDTAPRTLQLTPGPQTIDFPIPTAKQPRTFNFTITSPAREKLFAATIPVPAFREITIYITPHSHHDLGYTEIQTAIEEKQLNNLLTAMDAAERTASYPEGARFVWNLEGTSTADVLLRRLDEDQRTRFLNHVRTGSLALNGMYFNTLTGLCRPEELIDLFRFGTELRTRTGATLDSAIISDVPGYTWGTVTALNQAGIKYLSAAANTFDRVGTTNVAWENKPFWWIGPSGHERVLVWPPFGGYNLAARIGRISPVWVESFLTDTLRTKFPYDIGYIRWSRGDNAPPDTTVSDQVREWNTDYAWPRFVIGSIHDAFSALEKRYDAQIPEARGDWTPYWEDGAGSSAYETAENRDSSDRLTQAAALWTILRPATYPAPDFTEAMRKVLLYSEHTWGASASVTAPASKETQEQWAIKRSYADAASSQSRDLMERARALGIRHGPHDPESFDIINTNAWPRSALVQLPKDFARAGNNLVTDDTGAPVPTQRLSTGELVLWAENIPALSARRYKITRGNAHAPRQKVTAIATTLDNGILKITLDEKTGGIIDLRSAAAPDPAHNYADTASGHALNDYLYFNGSDPATARGATDVTIRIKDKGPLVATLSVESAAPGCHALTREIRLTAGCDYAELTNIVDKARLVAKSYRDPEGKESVNFAFPFNVSDGQIRVEAPLSILRPDTDQIPGACKNWFTVGRWTDVSNKNYGITWITLDAPLLQLGGLTANLLNSQTNPNVWLKQVGPTQKLFSWAMNNHWGTNYRAYQEGPVTFRYVLRPHAAYNGPDATRLAIGASQPLLPLRAYGEKPLSTPLFTLDSPDAIVYGLKPSDDDRAIIIRLWNAGDSDISTTLTWSATATPAPTSIHYSDTSELPRGKVSGPIKIPARAVVTLRAER